MDLIFIKIALRPKYGPWANCVCLKVHLRGLLLIIVIPTAAEGSRLSFTKRTGGVELPLLNKVGFLPYLPLLSRQEFRQNHIDLILGKHAI
jgi:hypothetical protein